MADRLIYLPLGGAGEIGMNAYVYGYGEPGRERLIVVDLGVTFGDMDSAPGIDLIMADLSWLEANRDRIEAIFITHGHEDHVGALGLLWPGCKSRSIAASFTGALARLKLEEAGQPTDQCISTPAPGGGRGRPLQGAVRAGQPFDPGKLGADHRHAGGPDRPYRRFQAGRHPGRGRGLRPDPVARDRA
jgi:glyoxylase-like metal-dependent hydrolase (beta-lactamase superfamily II)